MSNKENETLAQRKKAQQSLIELKKMQAQENKQEHIAYQDEIKPKTFIEKLKNFWEYYKTAVISIAVLTSILAVCVVQCATKKEDDLRIVVFDNQIISNTQIMEIENYFESLCSDINGDGSIVVTVVDCTFQAGGSTAEYQQTKMQKLQTLIAADETAMLFVTSGETYKYIDDLGLNGLLGEAVALKKSFYDAVNDEIPLKEDLTISVRQIKDTLVENNKTAIEFHKRASAFVENYKTIEE